MNIQIRTGEHFPPPHCLIAAVVNADGIVCWNHVCSTRHVYSLTFPNDSRGDTPVTNVHPSDWLLEYICSSNIYNCILFIYIIFLLCFGTCLLALFITFLFFITLCVKGAPRFLTSSRKPLPRFCCEQFSLHTFLFEELHMTTISKQAS